MAASLTVVRYDDDALLALEGALDGDLALALTTTVGELTAEGVGTVVLDLRRVTSLATHGIGAVILSSSLVTGHGGVAIVHTPGAGSHRVGEIAVLADVLHAARDALDAA